MNIVDEEKIYDNIIENMNGEDMLYGYNVEELFEILSVIDHGGIKYESMLNKLVEYKKEIIRLEKEKALLQVEYDVLKATNNIG